jgi:hypothetical protein
MRRRLEPLGRSRRGGGRRGRPAPVRFRTCHRARPSAGVPTLPKTHTHANPKTKPRPQWGGVPLRAHAAARARSVILRQ